MAENDEMLANPDKLLFAEDLMNYIMNYTIETTYKAMSVEIYRSFIYNAFNEDVKEAITFMYKNVHTESMNFYLIMLHLNSVNLTSYIGYAKFINHTYVIDNCNEVGFLHYCARLAGLAMYFYKHGVFEAPNFAIKCIVNALPNSHVAPNFWATLNTASRHIANTKNDTLNQLAQQPTSRNGASVSSAGCSCFLNEYKFKIQNVATAFHQIPKCSCALGSMDDSNEFKECSPASFVNSSNFEENKVVIEPLSDDIVIRAWNKKHHWNA